MHQNFLEVPETYKNISRSHGGCCHTCGQSAGAPKPGQFEEIHGGSGEVNISASIRAPCNNSFWKFLRHIGTLLDHLGGVDTPMGGAPVPKKKQN